MQKKRDIIQYNKICNKNRAVALHLSAKINRLLLYKRKTSASAEHIFLKIKQKSPAFAGLHIFYKCIRTRIAETIIF